MKYIFFLISISIFLFKILYSVPPPNIKTEKPKIIIPKIQNDNKKDNKKYNNDNTYSIIIEQNGLENPNYITYRKENDTNEIQFPKEYFRGKVLKKNTRYILKVTEIEESNQTFLKFVEQLEPKVLQNNNLPKELTITIEPIDDYRNITYTFIKNGVEILETLNDTFIKGIDLKKGIRYKLKVKPIYINDEYLSFQLIEQIEPTLFKEELSNLPPHISYNCKNENKQIVTFNDIIIIDYILEDDNSLKISTDDTNIPAFKFYGNICDFKYYEDHKYILEVKKDGNDYKLINILCDEKMNYLSEPKEKIFNNCIEYDKKQFNETDTQNKINNNSKGILKRVSKITYLDSATWYLRYLFQADSVQPINILNNNYYYLITDTLLNKIKIITPCTTLDDKLIIKDKNECRYEPRTISLKKCDTITDLLLKQLRAINHYTIENNILKLSVVSDNGEADPKTLIILEGFPK